MIRLRKMHFSSTLRIETQGIIRHIDGIGRIVIPLEYRQFYKLEKDTPVEVIGTDAGILIRASKSQHQ